MTRTAARTLRIHPSVGWARSGRLLGAGTAGQERSRLPHPAAGAADRIRRTSPTRRFRRPAGGLDLVRTIAARRLHLVRPVTRRLNLVRPVAGRLHVLTAWRLDLIARRPLGTRDGRRQRG